MIRKLIKRFWYTRFGLFIIDLTIKYNQAKFEKEFLKQFNFSAREATETIQDSVKHNYREGIIRIKKKINQNVTTNQNHDKILKAKDDLVPLAREETEAEKQRRLALESIYVYKGKDIKNILDEHKMIDTRINEYKTLQVYNEEKTLIREIKKARKEGDILLAERLENEWKYKYRITKH